jgi:L-cysteine/cystine lyase
VAGLLGCEAGEVALTHSTTDGINIVLSGIPLPPGSEVLTTDEEHPGLLAPLAALSRRRRVGVRTVPFAEVAGAVGPDTGLVACSHVSWASGRVADTAAIARTGVPLLLDGAQALGAIPVDVRALGCDFYAASGQKWLCGPDGSGYLYVRRERIPDLGSPWPSFACLSEPARATDLVLHPDARRFDLGVVPGPPAAWAGAAFEVLAQAGWAWVLDRGPALAATLADLLQARGLEVVPRGPCTLVAWAQPGADDAVAALLAEGFVVRALPGGPVLRASVGAWSSLEELEALADRAAALAA